MADIERVCELEMHVWGDNGASSRMLDARLTHFQDGNLLAVDDTGDVCGYASYCLLDYDEYRKKGTTTWYDLSGNGTASTHSESGPDLFGINLSVARTSAAGVSSRLLEAVIVGGIARRCRRGLLGARLPSYHKYADKMCAPFYAFARRQSGRPIDPEVAIYEAAGLRPLEVVEGYFKDADSLDWGLVMEKENPFPRGLRTFGSLITPALARLLGLR